VQVGDSKHVPALLEAGQTYHWRVDTLSASGTTTGETFTFGTRQSGGLQPDKLSYAPGETMTIRFDGADAARDWIALHPRTTAYGGGSAGLWKYLNDSESAPGSVVSAGTVTLSAPVTAGLYVLRFFDDDSYTVEDELQIVVE
jgi:hypothetical protein